MFVDSIEEECSLALCSAQLQLCNQQLGTAFQQWAAALSRLNTYASLLAFQSQYTRESCCREALVFYTVLDLRLFGDFVLVCTCDVAYFCT